MAYRSVHTKIWSDPWFTEISANAQHLFLYLLTNEHRRESGFYPLSLKTMSFETNRPTEQIKTLLEELSEKVRYDYENKVVWVVNAIKHLSYSISNTRDKRVINIVNDLRYSSSPLVVQFLDTYPEIKGVYRPLIEDNKGSYMEKEKEKIYGEGEGEDKEEGVEKIAEAMRLPAEATHLIAQLLRNSPKRGKRQTEQIFTELKAIYSQLEHAERKTGEQGYKGLFIHALQEAVKHNAKSVQYVRAIVESEIAKHEAEEAAKREDEQQQRRVDEARMRGSSEFTAIGEVI